MTDEWWLRSASGAQNWQENQKKHCISFVPTEAIADKLSKKLDRPVSMIKVYNATHMKKDNTMIDEFSQRVMDTYKQILHEQRCKRMMLDLQSGICNASAPEGQGMGEEGQEGKEGLEEEDEGEPTETHDDHKESITGVDRGQLDLNAWLESTGDLNKGRVIGFGLSVQSSTILGSSANASTREYQYASSGE